MQMLAKPSSNLLQRIGFEATIGAATHNLDEEPCMTKEIIRDDLSLLDLGIHEG